MDNNEIVHLAAAAGKVTLENGGETYRVEQTIAIICSAYGLPNTESYVTPTGIMISTTDNENNTISVIKRISTRTVNLEKVALINDLSRKISGEKLAVDEVKRRLKEIDNTPKYSKLTTTFFSAFAASSFTLLFGGSFRDLFISFIIGTIISLLSIKLGNLGVNGFFINMLGGSVAAVIALTSVRLGIGINEDKIVIGSIMLLVPGLAITNAIRDTIAGDLVSGISRSIEAFFIAIAIAVGTGVIFNIWFSFFGGV